MTSGDFRISLLLVRQWIHVASVYGVFWNALVVNIGSGMCMVVLLVFSAPRAAFLSLLSSGPRCSASWPV